MVKLLALDVDGTLLRDDGSLADQDRHAIARARAAGVVVTLATGRLLPSALSVARDLALEAPLVCVDGAVLVCPQKQEVLHTDAIPPERLRPWLASVAAAGLAPFLFTPEEIVTTTRAYRGPDRPLLEGWSLRGRAVDDLDRWLGTVGRAEVVAAVAVGDEDLVSAAAEGAGDPLATFALGDTGRWALRLSSDATKATGLERLAARYGFGREDVAVVGDWYNDLPMLSWAGRSFVMPHAPEPVVQAAGQVLRATARTGGAVAEVVDVLFADAGAALTVG